MAAFRTSVKHYRGAVPRGAVIARLSPEYSRHICLLCNTLCVRACVCVWARAVQPFSFVNGIPTYGRSV